LATAAGNVPPFRLDDGCDFWEVFSFNADTAQKDAFIKKKSDGRQLGLDILFFSCVRTDIMAEHEQHRLKGICRKVADTCMGIRVRRVSRVVGNHYDEHLKPVGLKGTQFTLLNAINLYPSSTISRLADLMLLDRTTLNRNLKPLEREGLIRSGHGKDLRTRTLDLTPQGVEVLQLALPLWLEAQSAIVDIMGGRIQRLGDDLTALEKLSS